MILIDTHSHIYVPEFDNDREAILQRAEKEGVAKILLPAIDSETHPALIRLQEKYPDRCIGMMGLHPCSVKENYKEELAIARDYFTQHRFVAVGEMGLDFYWDKTFTEQQYTAFHEQIGWALELDLPIVIHSRNSTNECIEVVKQYQENKLRGVFHCFSGNADEAARVIAMGFYLGIGGVVTFKNSGLDKVLENVPLSNIVLETDAPYLAPVPFRGKRNEPAYLIHVVNKLAALYGCTTADIQRITTENANRLFRLEQSV
ncbi:MAG: TatD family hydrolase [Bacteroidetes bacterium]|nr:TatD family hydrolase [Bacteroidota bacterium]